MTKDKIITKGQANKIIDTLLHPLFRKSKAFVLVDGLAHALIEQNPKESAKKFIKYNLKDLIGNKKHKEGIDILRESILYLKEIVEDKSYIVKEEK